MKVTTTMILILLYFIFPSTLIVYEETYIIDGYIIDGERIPNNILFMRLFIKCINWRKLRMLLGYILIIFIIIIITTIMR